MNASVPGSQLRQPELQDMAAFTPVSIVKSVTKKSDALPVISVIVVLFVLLAVFIVLVVHYGPQLRTVQVTLHHEPMAQHMDSVLLTDWRRLDAHGKMGSARVTCHCSCNHHLPHGSAEPNVIEITYL
ncbi:small integral membrane protein 33 [Onychostruthus taczanowskii]|uniref:small integral membrane protein 33 n=1 Tax=Onychostruthus taczanowskii TaxID=356909 RepID=UPI001B80D984|nr:small integral membrane protein 33 [Onychostruthus taczanowskii]